MWSRLRKGADHVAGRVPLLASGSDGNRVLKGGEQSVPIDTCNGERKECMP